MATATAPPPVAIPQTRVEAPQKKLAPAGVPASAQAPAVTESDATHGDMIGFVFLVGCMAALAVFNLMDLVLAFYRSYPD
jgi:hypothetical protein